MHCTGEEYLTIAYETFARDRDGRCVDPDVFVVKIVVVEMWYGFGHVFVFVLDEYILYFRSAREYFAWSY